MKTGGEGMAPLTAVLNPKQKGWTVDLALGNGKLGYNQEERAITDLTGSLFFEKKEGEGEEGREREEEEGREWGVFP